MRTFYITFGSGTIFRGYHAAFEAMNEDIVRAFMNKRYGHIWSNCYTKEPNITKPLQEMPEKLCYARMEDV